jgi:hypothetical protein
LFAAQALWVTLAIKLLAMREHYGSQMLEILVAARHQR